MIFTSYSFLFWFLPTVLLAHWLMPRPGRNLLLVLCSFVFYGWWRVDLAALMLVSTAVDYVAARRMATSATRGRWLWLSVAVNLGLLGYFKYANLVVETANEISGWAGGGALDWEKVILPMGISFYTFQSMSYTIDVYRREVEPVRSFVDLLCYVSLFPQLVAGPIVRYRDLGEQLRQRSTDLIWLSTGAFMFMVGFAKKVLVADSVAHLADAAFAADAPGMVTAWTGVAAYTVQIYFDFSGYSDMAIGLGLMLGFRFPRNFYSPYQSASITEFWRRWHITLSTWLRDYLYIPLGGNRKGPARTARNLMVTMLLGGLWHGAAWTFVLWGAFHGALLGAERLNGRQALWARLPRPLGVICTLLVVMLGWTLFRASSTAELGRMLTGLFGANGLGGPVRLEAFGRDGYLALAVGFGLALFCRDSWTLARRFWPPLVLFAGACFVLALGRLFATEFSPFLYFQF